jgi:hypothetical protein
MRKRQTSWSETPASAPATVPLLLHTPGRSGVGGMVEAVEFSKLHSQAYGASYHFKAPLGSLPPHPSEPFRMLR